ncbi:MAG: hypothetical protein HKN35_05045 [Woeseia sp.]|nr:hypothetical protein [Woeseia sp.]MBT8095764.1 hypothetical protein [Woeseia sp.]NNE60235.1 hypothetical protein [Woeseia sp.]NNL55148.1 hypothetical protein [Woeseia sp.]
MFKTLMLLAVIAAVVAIVLTARRKTSYPSHRQIAANNGSQFHGVSIRPGLSSCHAASALTGKRFLPDAIPLLPLKDCSEPTCSCRFEHHRDRRDEDDRRDPLKRSLAAMVAERGENRRDQAERRDSDNAEEPFSN